MKIAYSLLLGEHIEAGRIDYQECKTFQITCPACSEPVFKGVKQFPAKDEPTHYFAHYEKSKSYVEECELRVGALKATDIEKVRAESRDQRLAYFLSVFGEAIEKMLKVTSEGFQQPQKLWWLVAKLKRSKPVAEDLFQMIYEAHQNGFAKFSDAEFDEIFDTYVDDFGSEYLKNYAPESFSLLTLKRLARDFYRYLISAPARDNFKLLFIAGYFMVYYRMLVKRHLGEPYSESFEAQLHRAFFELPEMNRQKGRAAFHKMSQTPVRYRSGGHPISLLGKVQTEISHEMFGVLLKLPYLDMLREAKEDSFSDLNSGIVGKS